MIDANNTKLSPPDVGIFRRAQRALESKLLSHPIGLKGRVGLYGGSFDPTHLGHPAVAMAAKQQESLDLVLFIPAAQNPLKAHQPKASNLSRMEMLALAIADIPGFFISDIEIARAGTSYTIDTVRALKTFNPEAEFFLIMGQDNVRNIESWKNAKEIFQLAEAVLVGRPGSKVIEPASCSELQTKILQREIIKLAMPESSSEVRERIAQGNIPNNLLAPDVATYIKATGLYLQESLSSGKVQR